MTSACFLFSSMRKLYLLATFEHSHRRRPTMTRPRYVASYTICTCLPGDGGSLSRIREEVLREAAAVLPHHDRDVGDRARRVVARPEDDPDLCENAIREPSAAWWKRDWL